MERIQLTPARSYPFACDIQIHISHANQVGHLDKALLLTQVS
jgi:hypothetical protein